jgi:carbamoyl-phosphate synthase large subunit
MPKSTKVLVTGAGGPAGMGTIRSLLLAQEVKVVAADMNPMAPGLFWPPEKTILPPAHDRNFVSELLSVCKKFGIDVLFPTVDEEVSVLAANMNRLRGEVECLIGKKKGVDACNDKWGTYVWLNKVGIPVVETLRVHDKDSLHADADEIGYPLAIKPRASRGGRGLHICQNYQELIKAFSALKAALPFVDAYVNIAGAADLILQEYLPGTEYDTIVMLSQNGKALACVPMRAVHWEVHRQQREIVTEHNKEVELICIRAVRELGLHCPVDVEVAQDRRGNLKILDVNPRVGGDVDLATAAGCNIPLMYVKTAMGREIPACEFKEGLVLIRYVGVQIIKPEDTMSQWRDRK